MKSRSSHNCRLRRAQNLGLSLKWVLQLSSSWKWLTLPSQPDPVLMREVNLKKTRSWAEISTTSFLPALCPISKDMVSLRSLEAFLGSFLFWSHNSPGTKPHISHRSHLFPSSGYHNYCAQDSMLCSLHPTALLCYLIAVLSEKPGEITHITAVIKT